MLSRSDLNGHNAVSLSPRPTTPTLATMTTDNRDQWLTVSQVAEIEGITQRAVQRKAANGKYRQTRRIETHRGEQWQINIESLGKRLKSTATAPTDNAEPKHPDNRDTPRPNTQNKEVERLESEVIFLRGLIEQRDRDNAELRATLREALKAMPKAITSGNAPKSTDNQANEDSPTESTNPPKIAQKRDPRPLWKLMLGIR